MPTFLLTISRLLFPLGLSLLFCFFIGIFWNPRITTIQRDAERMLYINRGYPKAWAGVSLQGKQVEFPLVKAPFLPGKTLENGVTWVKVVDLRFFALLFIPTFLGSLVFQFILIKAYGENSRMVVFLLPLHILVAAGLVFFYFFWFPRI